ncbi:MAG: F0F1 ATP synthase subunit B [Oscillospiraceae bacterium]|nr:F0F1 ATP synthase subunit B [Oscillospiraceae bacterium]
MKVLDFISIVPWTIVAQICNLLILTLLVKKFLFKPVQAILAKRQQEIEDTYTAADTAKESAETLKAEYETHLASAKEEAAEILKSATQRATVRSEEIITDAKHTAANVKAKAEADIAQEKKKAMNEMKNEIGSIAMSIATEVIGREVNEKDHTALIEDFIKNVGDAS